MKDFKCKEYGANRMLIDAAGTLKERLIANSVKQIRCMINSAIEEEVE